MKKPDRIPPSLRGLPDLAAMALAGLRSAEAEPNEPHPVIHSVTVRLKEHGNLSRADVELIGEYAKAAAIQATRL